MSTQKGSVSILIILLAIIVIGGGIYFYSENNKGNQANDVKDSPLQSENTSSSTNETIFLENETSTSTSSTSTTQKSTMIDNENKINNECEDFKIETKNISGEDGVITFGNCKPPYSSGNEDRATIESFSIIEIKIKALKEKYENFSPIFEIYSGDKLVYARDTELDSEYYEKTGRKNISRESESFWRYDNTKKINLYVPFLSWYLDFAIEYIGGVGKYRFVVKDKYSNFSRSGDFEIIYPRLGKYIGKNNWVEWVVDGTETRLIEKETGKIIAKGKTSSFKSIETNYFILGDKVYFISYNNQEIKEVWGADFSTFEYLETCMGVEKFNLGYYKDKNNVYVEDRIISKDASNFKIIGNNSPESDVSGYFVYAKDNERVYEGCGEIIPNANPKTFEIPNN